MLSNLNLIDPLAKLLGEWSYSMNAGSIIFRILLTLVFGAILGVERSRKRHSAGLRTFMIATIVPCVAMMIDSVFYADGKGMFLLSAASLIGIAIVSTNTILFSSRSKIKGLTTSVALWGSSIIGIAIGASFYLVGIIAFVGFMIALAFLPSLEFYLKNRSNHFEIHLELKKATFLNDFLIVIRQLGLNVDDIELNPAYHNSGLSVYSISLTIKSKELKKYKTHNEIIESLRSLEYVSHIEEDN